MTLAETVRICQEILGCEYSRVCSYVNIKEDLLFENLEKTEAELIGSKCKRIFNLKNILNICGDFPLSKQDLKEVLLEQVFDDFNGVRDSVVSAISQDKYSEETLKNIFKISANNFLSKNY